ncbi:MAG: SDR family oxidoreductase [Spirochaetes bacterium]|nr:SDR family oxidoreductase [Spirochaetota bacterium]
MKKKIDGSVAVITGGAGGIGTAIARLFDQKGIRCALCDIDEKGLRKAGESLSTPPLLVTCDITDRKEIGRAIKKIRGHFGGIDILVNNAGIIVPSLFENCSYRDMDRQIAINLVGAMNFTREIIEPLKENGGGCIITTSSLAGIVPETHSAVYSATKFALRGFNLTLHIELKRHGIFVGTVFPDSIDTPMLRYEAAHGGSPLTFLSTPQKPEAVARAVYRAIAKRKIESYVPSFSATLPKILTCIPRFIPPIWGMLERSGVKKKLAYQREHGIGEDRP